MARDVSKLEEAVEKQARCLETAQYEFIMAQFEHYKWNAEKISVLEGQYDEISEILDTAEFEKASDRKAAVERRNTAYRERHQLITEQGVLFSSIMRWLKGTAAEQSEIEAFLA